MSHDIEKMNENVVDPAIKENPPSDTGSDVHFFEDRIRSPIPALTGDLLFPFDIDAVQPFFYSCGQNHSPFGERLVL